MIPRPAKKQVTIVHEVTLFYLAVEVIECITSVKILNSNYWDAMVGPFTRLKSLSINEVCDVLQWSHLPMFRHVSEPFNATVFVPRAWIQVPCT